MPDSDLFASPILQQLSKRKKQVTWENRKFQLESQMVRAIPFGKLKKLWATIWGDAIFLLF